MGLYSASPPPLTSIGSINTVVDIFVWRWVAFEERAGYSIPWYIFVLATESGCTHLQDTF